MLDPEFSEEAIPISVVDPVKNVERFLLLHQTTEKWSTLRHKVCLDPRTQFENILAQMVNLGPRLGLNYEGSQDDINDAMM